MKLGLIFILFSVICTTSTLLAQPGEVNYSEYLWYFGNSTNTITFNKSDARAQIDTIQATPYGRGGGVVITDPVTGDLIFYSDGQNVYDINHELVPNGTGLNGNTALNQSAVVFPFPYTDGQYYIFTNSGTEIEYTLLDKNLAGNGGGALPPRGEVVAGAVNMPTGLIDPGEGMIMIKQNINNHWLITYDVTNNVFNVSLVDVTGIIANTQQDPWTIPVPAFEPAAFAWNNDSSLLAVAPKDPFRNVVLLDFDTTSGTMGLNRAIINSGNGDQSGQSIYDVEWSPDGSKLYISRFGDSGVVGDLYQYDLLDTLDIVNSVLSEPVYRSYGLQRGPDQNIYHLYEQTNGSGIEIGMLTESDSLFHADSAFFNVGYDSLAFDPSGIDALQFPAFAAPHFEQFDSVSFVVIDTCTSTSTKFFSYVEPTPSDYRWDFGDGGPPVSAVSPVYTYAAPGLYNVRLTVTLNGVVETFSQNINIGQTDLMIDLGQDTVRCPGEIFVYDAGAGGASYAWNTGETTQTINADTTGIYSVAVVSTATGCMSYAFVEVTTYEDETQFGNQWYFGEMAGIDFNPLDSAATAITDANLMDSPSASSSVSDLNGKLRFYTNGVTIWNQDHEVMTNGNNIGGDSTSMQGTMIVPLPGDSSIYYVFTSDPVYGDGTYNMRYSVVDMRLDSAKGEVVVKDMPLFANSTERMTGSFLGGSSSWVVTHEFGSNTFRSYPITVAGIQSPVTSAMGSVHRFDQERTATGQMQVNEAGNIIAVAYQEQSANYVELFEMDVANGEVEALVKIDIDEPLPNRVYGVNFDGVSSLYVTTNENGSKLLTFELDSLYAPTAKADIENSKVTLGQNATMEYGAMQLGSDGTMYMAIDNQTTIGTINGSSFTEDGFDLMGRTSRLGLPNLAQQRPVTITLPGISFMEACLGQDTQFTGSSPYTIDTHTWTFGDGGGASFADTNSSDTTHIYNLEGLYDVSLTITNRCGMNVQFLEQIEVFAIPADPTVPDAASLCNGDLVLEAWPRDTTFTYNWSTGDTSRVLNITQRGIYNIFLTDTNGCNSNPISVFVDDLRPQVDLGVDLIVCQSDTLADLNGQNPGSSYIWTVNGTNTVGDTLQVKSIDTSTSGTFVYGLEVTDLFGCVTEDSVSINVNNFPIFSTITTDNSSCNPPPGGDGNIQINMGESGSFTYEIAGPVNVSQSTVTSGIAIAGGLSGGTYNLIMTNTLTGCINQEVFDITDLASPFTISNVTGAPDCPGDGILDVELAPQGGGGSIPINVDFTLTNQLTGASITSSSSPVGNTFSINDLDSGTYTLQVVDSNTGCTQTSSPVNLAGNPLVEFTLLDQVYCGNDGRIGLLPITTGAGIDYQWSGPGTIGTQGDSITVNLPGTYYVTGLDSNGGFCESNDSLVVTQSAAPIVEIDITGNECDGQLLLQANVTNGLVGNGSYQWNTGSLTSQITVTSSDTYSVFVMDQGTGCTGETDSLINVFNEITVFVAAEPNCDENAEVLVSAFANITEDVTFSWTDPSGNAISEQSAEISVGESGLYTILVSSDVSDCEATADMDVMVVPILDDELLMPADTIFCSLDPDPSINSVLLDPGQFASYEWTVVNDDVILSTDRTYLVTEGNFYQVTMTNGFTCIRDIIEVSDDCLPRIEAPNAFTPSTSPGVNDEFFVFPNPYVTDFSISIYSRWGELVYQSNDIAFRWDGWYRGTVLQGGTYVYVMRFTSSVQPERGVIEQHGGVILLD